MRNGDDDDNDDTIENEHVILVNWKSGIKHLRIRRTLLLRQDLSSTRKALTSMEYLNKWGQSNPENRKLSLPQFELITWGAEFHIFISWSLFNIWKKSWWDTWCLALFYLPSGLLNVHFTHQQTYLCNAAQEWVGGNRIYYFVMLWLLYTLFYCIRK